MKEDRLIFHGCFDEPLEVITDLVGRYLDELVKVRPQVVLEVKVTDDKKTWRGYVYEPQAWSVEDINYGYIEVFRKYEDSAIPLEVKVFASHPDYFLWMFNLYVLLEKYLKVSDGNPPANIPTWMVIPDEGYNRQLVELWSQGYKGPEIALRFSYSPRTIYNRLSELRKIYGVTIVPLKIKRKKTKNKVNPVN